MLKIDKMLTNECWKGANTKQAIIIHHTGSSRNTLFRNIVNFFKRRDYISVHYVVGRNEEDGIVQMVDENDRAWHAGASQWGDLKDLNHSSIGIEVLSDGHTFTDWQRDKVRELCMDIMKRNEISPSMVLRHADIAPKRKWDIGVNFFKEKWGTWQGFQQSLKEDPERDLKELHATELDLLGTIREAIKQLNKIHALITKAEGRKNVPFKLTKARSR